MASTGCWTSGKYSGSQKCRSCGRIRERAQACLHRQNQFLGERNPSQFFRFFFLKKRFRFWVESHRFFGRNLITVLHFSEGVFSVWAESRGFFRQKKSIAVSSSSSSSFSFCYFARRVSLCCAEICLHWFLFLAEIHSSFFLFGRRFSLCRDPVIEFLQKSIAGFLFFDKRFNMRRDPSFSFAEMHRCFFILWRRFCVCRDLPKVLHFSEKVLCRT